MSASRPWSGDWAALAKTAALVLSRSRGRPRRGAAAQDETGAVHSGTSLSFADLPAASLCAEHAAIAGLCASGARTVRRLAVVGPPPNGAPPPCGRCLQILLEFGPDVEIRWGTPGTERGRSSLRRLLPHPFEDYRGTTPR